MQTYINEDASYFDGVDFENAKPIEHPLVKKIQANAKSQDEQLLDDDILDWLKQHPDSKRYVNEMIRNAIAMQVC